MKNLCLTAATIAAAALLFSCEQQEQSVFNPESLPGTAVITGTVTYDEGSANFEYNEDGVIAEHIIPAAGQIAVLTIPYSEYNPSSEGNQVFTDTIGRPSGRGAPPRALPRHGSGRRDAHGHGP